MILPVQHLLHQGSSYALLAVLSLDLGCSGESDGPGDPPSEPAALAGITTAHNQVRAGVGVGPLTWNADLEATAQTWADGCADVDPPSGLIDVNPNRSTGHPYYVGENTYGTSGAATIQAAVAQWAAEAANYDYATNTCTSGDCSHYTQLVWETSQQLGCGISSCPGLAFGNSIVCNYGPGGNTGGRPY